MNGYKTGGDWTDVTSAGRNEIVFEGRHKAYGAFYIRQRYPNTLFLALLSAIIFVGLCAFVPYVVRSIVPQKPLPTRDIIINPTDIIIPQRIIIPPPVSHPAIHPSKGPEVPHNAPPVIIIQPIDSAPSIPNNHLPAQPNGTNNNGNDLPNPNPTPPGGGSTTPPMDNAPVSWVPEMPKFPGGKIEDYLANQLRYPAEAVQLGMQGTVYVSFIIEKDGSVSNVKLVKGISNGDNLNKEAIRVLSEMPLWVPGKQDGHPVRVQFVVPIHFKLQ